MYELSTSIDIDAPRERVWQVLTAFSEYDEWNPFMSRLSGVPLEGGDFAFYGTVSGREFPIQARFTRVSQNEELRWTGPRSKLLGKLFRADHFFRLEAIGPSETRFVHGERFGGLVIPAMWNRFKPTITKTYENMNASLKRRVESRL